MVGVCLAVSDRAPKISRIKEIAEVMDPLPALPEKLIELGHWVSRYYMAPVGETFRAMLPPEVELRHDREYWLTDAGRAYLQELAANEENTPEEAAELELLRHLDGRQVGGHIGEVLRGNLEVGAGGVVYHVEQLRKALRLGLRAGDSDHGRHEAAVGGAGDLDRKLLRERGSQALDLKLGLLGELHALMIPGRTEASRSRSWELHAARLDDRATWP